MIKADIRATGAKVRTEPGRREDTVMGDAELVTRFAAGEPGSAAEMYRTYGRLVYAVTNRVLDDAGLAENATRGTFARAWRLAATFDPSSGLGPWLATIARGIAIDIDRRNRDPRHSAAGAAIADSDPVDQAHSAENLYDRWLVRRALDTLSDEDREIIRLQHHGRLTPTEISDRLAIPLGSLKSRSHRAHRRFNDLLGQLRAARDTAAPSDGLGPGQSRAGRSGARP